MIVSPSDDGCELIVLMRIFKDCSSPCCVVDTCTDCDTLCSCGLGLGCEALSSTGDVI